MKDYYYVSEGIVKQFPELEKSKPFEGFAKTPCYIAVIPDFTIVENFLCSHKGHDILFAYQCVDSQVDLTYDAIDYDEDDNELEVKRILNIEVCKEWGLITAIEQELGISKEQNIAYAIYKLAEQENVTPVDLIELIYPSFKPTTLRKAERLKGKKLNAQEKMIIDLFGSNKEYRIALDARGHICAHKIER